MTTPRSARLRAVVAAASWLAALLLAGAARAEEPGSELTISVLTFGPGDHPFYKFGHDALLVHDAARHADDVYNYGTFDFHSPTLIRDFLGGRLLYWLSVQPLRVTLEHYRAENRTVVAQELALTPAERLALEGRLVENARPENRAYRYDYYRDNCATRVRDVLDAVLGGRLRAASNGPASLTLRGHTERLTADALLVYLGLDAAMGDVIDRPLSSWDEMFLPSKLEESLRRVEVDGPSGPAPLVARETVLVAADRPPLRASPPRWTVPMALAGLGAGALLAALGAAAARSRLARVAFASLLGSLGLVAGALGGLFAFLWLGTDHVVAAHNENLLQLSPVGLVLAFSAAGLALGHAPSARLAARVAAVIAAGAALGLVAKALPWFDQGNGHIVAMMVPVWFGAAVGAGRSRRVGVATPPPS